MNLRHTKNGAIFWATLYLSPNSIPSICCGFVVVKSCMQQIHNKLWICCLYNTFTTDRINGVWAVNYSHSWQGLGHWRRQEPLRLRHVSASAACFWDPEAHMPNEESTLCLKKLIKSKLTQKLKHTNSILQYFEYFCQISSKLIPIISS